MSVRHRVVRGTHARRRTAAVAGLLVAAMATAGCSSSNSDDGSSSSQPQTQTQSSASVSPSASTPARSAATVVRNVAAKGVHVDKTLTLTAKDGTFSRVVVKGAGKRLAGSMSSDKTSWAASSRLEPGTRYHVRTVAVDADGLKKVSSSAFRTEALTLDQQTFPSFAPTAGQTVGVGMPVIIRFDVPVTNRAAIEKHLSVTNTSNQRGAWHWLSDSEVHWRPVHYWKPGTDVTVKADINSVPAGNGIYGQVSRTATFHVGRSVISKVNAQTHQMKTYIDGKLARTTPITTGKPGFTTRSGIKVIVEKFRHKRMNSETIGIATNSSEGYDLDDVEYAMRLTYSGEFLHAAPWSVGSQGYANVSHGCTGMSTANAEWLYNQSKPGDVVEYTGTDRQMTLDNGYGDCNESFSQYAKG